MSLALVDVGSNTIRLSVYAIGSEAARIRAEHGLAAEDAGGFVRLVSKKVMAGLASYVDDAGALVPEGMDRACEALGYLRSIVENLGIGELHVFATASLRDISNSDEALAAIDARTGLDVELISREEEALLGYSAFQHDCKTGRGVLVDIGGGSTEVTSFDANEPQELASMPVGSLRLFKKNVARIFPTQKERGKIRRQVERALDEAGFCRPQSRELLCGIGGTSRAAAKLMGRLHGGASSGRFSRADLAGLVEVLEDDYGTARSLILRTCPDRAHTIMPGLIVLSAVADRFGAEKVKVSRYGVREGYLISHILGRNGSVFNAR